MPYPYSIAASIYPQRQFAVGNPAPAEQSANPKMDAAKRRLKKQKPGY